MTRDDTGSVIARTEVHYLQSAIVGEEYKLFIAHPPVAMPPGQLLPVLYVLDANATFGTVVETVRMLQLGGEMPPCYVVGIGYRVSHFLETMPMRSRDYTPTRFARYEEGYAALSGMPGSVVTGGAPAFLRFISEELNPWIAATLPDADIGDATLVGMSAGGAFATFALLTQPALFQRYLACSPALLWDDETLLALEQERAGGRTDLAARVFFACGALENQAVMAAAEAAMPTPMREAHAMVWRGMRMVEPLRTLEATLRGRRYPGLRLTVDVFDDEHHTSVFPAAVSRGLRVLFQP